MQQRADRLDGREALRADGIAQGVAPDAEAGADSFAAVFAPGCRPARQQAGPVGLVQTVVGAELGEPVAGRQLVTRRDEDAGFEAFVRSRRYSVKRAIARSITPRRRRALNPSTT